MRAKGAQDIMITDIARYRDAIQVGDREWIPKFKIDNFGNRKQIGWQRATIEIKAPFVTQTSKGTYSWSQLFLWRREHENQIHA